MSPESESNQEGRIVSRWLGRLDYRSAKTLMLELVEERARDETPDTLLLVEHPPVYTRGRAEAAEDVLDPAIEIIDVERGGRITFHGPGQLVAYPIVRLWGKGRDLHRFLRLLEDVLIDCLAAFGLEGSRDPLGTGVFVSGKKIASIGIAIRRWVTFHGIALNVSTDLRAFERIRPCGFDADLMTNLALELGREPKLSEVAARLEEAMQERLAEYGSRS
ncbi:MAG: lipoyl(octanoyl) transferase LipB [Planctomycetota bacterium]